MTTLTKTSTAMILALGLAFAGTASAHTNGAPLTLAYNDLSAGAAQSSQDMARDVNGPNPRPTEVAALDTEPQRLTFYGSQLASVEMQEGDDMAGWRQPPPPPGQMADPTGNDAMDRMLPERLIQEARLTFYGVPFASVDGLAEFDVADWQNPWPSPDYRVSGSGEDPHRLTSFGTVLAEMSEIDGEGQDEDTQPVGWPWPPLLIAGESSAMCGILCPPIEPDTILVA